MKGKIIEILKKYEGIEVAYQFNVATEREALTNKATSESIADEIIHLVNQEVERRIKERMPSEEWIASEARKRFTSNTGFFESAKYQGFIRCGKWLRSRLTNPGKQKTEGGE